MPEYKIKLPKPHPGQLEVMNSPARWKVLKCGRRWGKSLICQVISVKGMLIEHHIAYITPQFKLSKKFFKQVVLMLPKGIVKSSNKTDLVIELVTGGTISFFSGEALDALRGSKFHTVIIDEAAYIPNLEEGWLNSIRPTLSDYRGNAYFISTPRGRNYFYTLSLRGDNGDKGYQSFHFTTYDNPFISKAEVDLAKADVPKEVFNQEYLAIASANAGAVLSMDDIEGNTLKELSTNETVCYGIDVAKYTDYTVITGVDMYGKMTYTDRFQKDNELTKARIRELPKTILKVIDATHGSIGDSILEGLLNPNPQGLPGINIETVENIIGFQFTATTKPQLITEMILDVEKGECQYDQGTADELSIFEYTYSSTGHIKYGNAPGGHDDRVIALALANRYRKQAYVTSFSNSIE